jgi:hypothetical protein
LFFHLHTCIQNISNVFTIWTLSLYLSLSHCYKPPLDRTSFAFLFFVFVKKWHFHLFKIAIQHVSSWQFHVYMHYNPNWLISFPFLLSSSVLFLW